MNVPATPASFPKILQWLLGIVLAGIILYVGRSLWVPLSFAMLISFVLYPVCKWLEQKGMGKVAAILLCLVFVMLLLAAILTLLLTQLVQFMSDWETLQVRLQETGGRLATYLQENWGIQREQQARWLRDAGQNLSKGSLGMISQFVSATAVSLVLFVLIPVYAFLILYYRERWVYVLGLMFPGKSATFIRDILHKTIHSYYQFIKGMMLVYLIVGALNSIGLLLLGVPHAVLFGFIASILTFIPYVGILVASLMPITVAWLTSNTWWMPLGVVGVFAVVQYLEANVIFPWAVSQRMQLNTLATLMAIIVGGILWGGAGLILFIPFAGIAKLVADHTPELRVLAEFMDASPKAGSPPA